MDQPLPEMRNPFDRAKMRYTAGYRVHDKMPVVVSGEIELNQTFSMADGHHMKTTRHIEAETIDAAWRIFKRKKYKAKK